MQVRMLVQISGSHDGQQWPNKGGVADLPDDEANKLIGAEMAEAVKEKPAKQADEDKPVETRPAAQQGVEKRPAPNRSAKG